MADIYMLSEITRRHSPHAAITPVRVIRTAIGEKAASQLLAAHAVSGCDSTSGLYGHGKANVFRKIVKFVGNEAHTDMLESISASCREVVDAGLKLITMLYGGKEDDSLNHLRYVSHMHQLATSETQPHPERLPPTENAAKYHLMRVHLQVIQWKYLMQVELNPDEWGWKEEGGLFVPIATDIKAAPDDILNVISCKCRMLKKIPCSTQLCSCRKHGLRCVAACKHCCGKVCDNAEPLQNIDVSEIDDIEDESEEENNFHIVIDDLEIMAGVKIYEEVVDSCMTMDIQ